MTARRTLAALALAPLLASGLVACGDDSGGDSATDPSPAAGIVGADLEEGEEVDPGEFVQTVSGGLEASTTAHLTMKMSAGAAGDMSAEGDVDYTTTPPDVAMTMSLPTAGGEMDMRMVDGIFYLSMGELTEGKFWKLDPSDPDGLFGDLGLSGMVDQMDPGKALASMEDGISEVVYVGEEDGLDRYELTIDMQQMLESMDADLPRGAMDQMPESVSYDLWLDDQGRFTKMSLDELPLGGSTGSMEMTMSGWGEDVSIDAPPEDQVAEMPDMGSMMDDMSGSGAA